jgi:hypothetical protein
MVHQLASLTTGVSEAKTENYVVQAALQETEEVLTGNTLHLLCLIVISTELLLQHTVDELCFLLLLQLEAILRHLAVGTARLTLGFLGTADYRGLEAEGTATLNGWNSINCH